MYVSHVHLKIGDMSECYTSIETFGCQVNSSQFTSYGVLNKSKTNILSKRLFMGPPVWNKGELLLVFQRFRRPNTIK